MKREYIVGLVIAAVVLLLIGGGALLYGLSQGGNIPGMQTTLVTHPTPFSSKVNPTPAPSLVDIADDLKADYPELADLLENPELATVYKDFYLAYQTGGEPAARALAQQRGILNDDDEIVMTLVLDTEDTTTLIAELEAEGVIVRNHFRHLVEIAIPLTLIEEKAQSEDPDLILNRLTNLEHVIRIELPNKAHNKQGGVEGQGVGVTFANSWHEQGLTGQGVKVGVLDLGFADYEDLQGSELPNNVTLKAFGDDHELDIDQHGTACTEIVHEMAPEAELYLAYFDGSDLAMGQAVEWLIEQEVAVINNSTGSNGLTPMDGTGFVAELVDEAYEAGIFWVNAAGNEASSHYRGQFTDTDGDTFHEFAPDTQVIAIYPYGSDYETTIILSWDDWQNIDQDYDLILLDEEGDLIAKSEDSQDGQAGALPAEGFLYEFDDEGPYLLSIENFDGLARGDVTFDLFIHNGDLESIFWVREYSLSSPADANGSFTVGAVNWADDLLEFYSSQGPTTDGRVKPDLSAPSVVDSASYAPYAFDGTSAAAPHVAGAAALVKQAFPAASPDDIAAFLQERAVDLGDAGPDNAFGSGRLNLGANPGSRDQPEATPPPNAKAQPTSTPRVSSSAGSVPGSSSATDNADALVGFIILGGMCMVCLGGLVLMLMIPIALIRMVIKK